jgi:hypothetical protein
MSDEVFEAAKIRLADKPPVACASCGGQYTDRTHVDFGAAWDGPMLSAGDDTAGVIGVSVDDLVICDECLTAGARLLGLVDPDKVKGELEALAAQHEQVTERLAGAMAYINRLEAASQEREKLEALIKPKPRAKRGAGSQ